jgi:hypothetical protein
MMSKPWLGRAVWLTAYMLVVGVVSIGAAKILYQLFGPLVAALGWVCVILALGAGEESIVGRFRAAAYEIDINLSAEESQPRRSSGATWDRVMFFGIWSLGLSSVTATIISWGVPWAFWPVLALGLFAGVLTSPSMYRWFSRTALGRRLYPPDPPKEEL